MSVAEVLEDYPSLTKEQVLAAKAYAEATPKLGRPYPERTAKAAMGRVSASLTPTGTPESDPILANPHTNVAAWLKTVDDDTLAISVLTVQERWKGLARATKTVWTRTDDTLATFKAS